MDILAQNGYETSSKEKTYNPGKRDTCLQSQGGLVPRGGCLWECRHRLDERNDLSAASEPLAYTDREVELLFDRG